MRAPGPVVLGWIQAGSIQKVRVHYSQGLTVEPAPCDKCCTKALWFWSGFWLVLLTGLELYFQLVSIQIKSLAGLVPFLFIRPVVSIIWWIIVLLQKHTVK